tara:strand:+ start:131 stop:490 length:360 start_codon:yes stop_codon:yes gene_type:complete
MKKKLPIYSDLTNKQLQKLKENYIQKRVDSMDSKELKQFVLEIISHQINETIGKEEELEAWQEMSDFFGEKFEEVILEIQKKFKENENVSEPEKNERQKRVELLEKNDIEKEKRDMWED